MYVVKGRKVFINIIIVIIGCENIIVRKVSKRLFVNVKGIIKFGYFFSGMCFFFKDVILDWLCYIFFLYIGV